MVYQQKIKICRSKNVWKIKHLKLHTSIITMSQYVCGKFNLENLTINMHTWDGKSTPQDKFLSSF